uniref:Uncharacterized protein n=1 Tax=Arundo donax TaxID=35708 RepID=A0A0A9AV55_ARUDO
MYIIPHTQLQLTIIFLAFILAFLHLYYSDFAGRFRKQTR